MDNFPEEYKIILFDVDTNKPISNVAIRVTLFANRKNNYSFIPNISNNHGIIEFSKKWLIDEIDKEMKLFVMDYSSKLDECKSEIDIVVFGSEGVDKLINGMRLYKEYFNYTDDEIEKYKNVDNHKFISFVKKINIIRNENVEVIMGLKRKI